MKKPNERRVIKRSENCWIVNLTVSYNILDPHQLQLLEHAEKMKNYSGTMKRLQEAAMTESAPVVVSMPLSPSTHSRQSEEVHAGDFDSVSAFL